MARSRNIKPGFCQNEILGQLPVEARLLFAVLPMFADREGRMEDRPLRIRAQAFPYDSFDADGLLQRLHDTGFIYRYSVENTPFIQIVNFSKHQSPHVKEAASTLPAPDKHNASTRQPPDRPDANTSAAPPDSLIPDSFNSDSLQNQGSSPRAMNRVDYPPEFEEIWKAYPKRNGSDPKKAAFGAYKQRLKDGTTHENLMAAVDRYAAWCRNSGKVGTEQVMQARRFFGPGEEWTNDWKPPSAVAGRVPEDREGIIKAAKGAGIDPDHGYDLRVLRQMIAERTGMRL